MEAESNDSAGHRMWFVLLPAGRWLTVALGSDAERQLEVGRDYVLLRQQRASGDAILRCPIYFS